ncbi:helix-turn-helix transcriptional regulator [Vibrio sonorensis]|uniref:helix-turn-helix transcriptional regulator n=1 Tax=Vibrio sonorensis TaxID=1004316 RepID=UPI0008D9CE6F|nr:AraC family transcriptional regulator [Vibrio sonorensis]
MRQYSFIFRIVDAIEQRLPRKLDLEELSNTLNVSRWHLQHEFKRFTGISVGRYYRLRLLTLAIEQVSNSDQRIIDIALDFGFESQEALYRAIRSNFEVSPKHFRRNPILAKYVSFPPLDLRYLDYYQMTLEHPPKEVVFPEKHLVGVSGNFKSIFFDEESIHDGVDELWQVFNNATCHWDHSQRNYYTLEYRNNCSYRSGEFQMMSMCDGAEEASEYKLSKVDISQRKMWHFVFPNRDYIQALFVYLNQVFTFQNKLSLNRLPYIWSLDEDGSMNFWAELKPASGFDCLPASIVCLDTQSFTLDHQIGQAIPYQIPNHLVVKSQRIAYLLELFDDRLDKVNQGSECLLIGGVSDQKYTPKHDYRVQHLIKTAEGNTNIGGGDYLKCVMKGSIEQIGEDLDSLYYSYLSESKYYLRQGFEWITYAKRIVGQEWHIELLIPVSKR